jgi:hypothetical protein
MRMTIPASTNARKVRTMQDKMTISEIDGLPALMGKRDVARLTHTNERTVLRYGERGIWPSVVIAGKRLFPTRRLLEACGLIDSTR